MSKAYFAGGCFWCVTPIYKIWGVDQVVCGYSGGDEANPTYKDVKAQKTGHRETIELTYDPKNVSYDKLLEIYLANVVLSTGKGSLSTKAFLTLWLSTIRQRKNCRKPRRKSPDWKQIPVRKPRLL